MAMRARRALLGHRCRYVAARHLHDVQAIGIELECYAAMVDHPDRYEGVRAFNEKRPPNFQDAF